MQKKRILVLGGGGFLGGYMTDYLSEKKYEYSAPKRNELDVMSEDLEKFVKEYQPNVIVNAVGYTDVDRAEVEKEKAYELNADLPERLAEICNAHKILLVHFSTDYVFSGENQNGYAENAETNPLSVYGASKLAGEKIIIKNAEKYYLVRLSFPFGENERCFLSKLLLKIEEGNPLEMVTDMYCSATDMCELVKRTVELWEENVPSGIYHLVNEGQCSRYEFTQEVLQILGSKVVCTEVPSSKFPLPARRPMYSKLNNTKLVPLSDWRTALKKYLTKKIS